MGFPDSTPNPNSNGAVIGNSNGEIRLTGIVGTIIISETKPLDGYVVDPATQNQTVQVNAEDTSISRFTTPPSAAPSSSRWTRRTRRNGWAASPLKSGRWTAATVLTTGTYSARLNYRVLYKTNYRSGYQVLASNLLTSSNYSLSLNAIPMQPGEYVTDVYFDFGRVPVGFQSTTSPTLTVQVLGTVANNYQIINRADVGGKYQGTWQTAQAT